MRAPRLALLSGGIAALAFTSLTSPGARAQGAPGGASKELSIPATAGLQPLAVTADLARRTVRVTVGGATSEIGIDLPPDDVSPTAPPSIEAVAIGDGKRVIHVRVPSRTRADAAWEAILVGREPSVIWSGVTGYAHGEAGERAGEALDLPARGEAGDRVVVLGEVREDIRICDQARTILSPRVLDPQTLTLRGATMQRLPEAQRDDAERVIAAAHGGPANPPLARLLVATGASTAIGAPAALTDGDPATTWSEGRPSDGHGEFVVMRAPADVPITRLAITVSPAAPSGPSSPSTPSPHGAAPRSLFLVTEHRTIAVTLPEDAWMHPGAAYDVPLVDPLRAACLTLVLDKAYERPGEAHPEVTIAEVTAYSAFDAPGATLVQTAKALSGGGPRAEAAKAVLERAGDAGLAAAAAEYGALDAAGRALAIDAAIGAGTCEASASLLLAAMGDRDAEVARKGREKLERCGKRAAPALLLALKAPDEVTRANAATLVAAIAPGEALEPLVAELAHGGPATRAAVRSGVAKAARVASKEKLEAVLVAARSPDARLDLLRALEGALPSMAPEGEAAIGALASGSPPMRTRYLLVGPLVALARAGDAAASSRLAAMIAGDAEPAVRAHAADGAIGVAGAKDALAHAVESDASPRVREAALQALAGAKPPLPVGAIARRLRSDEWTFVRSAAAAALAASSAAADVDDALEAALADEAPTVREAVIVALAAHRDAHAARGVRARLEDMHETLEVRLAAAKALAALCDRSSVDTLTKLARRGALPMASDEEILIGIAAAEALGALHPADLAARLAPLAAKDARAEAQTAASHALATPATCH